MYPKQITEKIIELQAKGFSAEETQSYFKSEMELAIHLNTIYNHRKSTVAQEITDELIRQQQRDILKQQQNNPELSLKYRNELLKLLIPMKAEILTKNLSINKTEVTVNVSDMLGKYESLFEKAVVSPNSPA